MPESINIAYSFRFNDTKCIEIPLQLDEATLMLANNTVPQPAFWTELDFERCSVCPLEPQQHQHCPIALHLAAIVTTFHDYNSYDHVTVEVCDEQRRYIKETSLQNGLGPLMGIVMVSTGCPVMEPLRPLVRFHLPFASMEENDFRIVSMYLIAQYFREKHGKTPDWSLQGLQDIYNKVSEVNRCFAKRLRHATTRDASINALVVLDCFAKGVPFAVRTTLSDYEKYFHNYINDESVQKAGN